MKDPKRNPDAAERAFLFRLAKDLHMTVADLEQRMTVREFVEWSAFYTVLAKEEEAAHKRAEQKARGRRR
jgi:hypothetical protein